LVEEAAMKGRSIGIVLLGIYLLCQGLAQLFGIGIPGAVMGILALVAGLLLIVGR
jgi:putative effector of murein hydrolase LrgA (UPF0299 family)